MPANPTIQFDPSDVKRLQNAITEMQAVTKAEMPKVVRNTGRDFCRSAMKYTPLAPPKTKGRGFAKAGWVKAMMGLGMTVQTSFHAQGGKKALALSDFVDKLKAQTPSVLIANEIPYIEELDRGSGQNPPFHILAKATAETANKMEARLTRMGRRMAGKWGV